MKIVALFTPPTTDGGLPILDYEIWWAQSDNIYQLLQTNDENDFGFNVECTRAGDEFSFKIRARNEVGDGDLSDEKELACLVAPGPPQALVGTIKSG